MLGKIKGRRRRGRQRMRWLDGITDSIDIRLSQSVQVSASRSVLPMNIQLISFRIDWLDLLAVQGTLKSLLQHHSSKASILPCSAFFTVQLSHPYMTTGKTIALTRWTFVGKWEPPELLFEVSRVRWMHHLGPFPNCTPDCCHLGLPSAVQVWM